MSAKYHQISLKDSFSSCQAIDSSLAQMLTFDTSGIELYVTENNPKTLNSLIRRLKSHYKDNPNAFKGSFLPRRKTTVHQRSLLLCR